MFPENSLLFILTRTFFLLLLTTTDTDFLFNYSCFNIFLVTGGISH